GMIDGEVRVPMVILNGTVLGNVYASERVELAPKSKVTGDVTYNLIEMAVGAEVNGRLLHNEKPSDGLPLGPAVKLTANLKKKERETSLVSES
ncbi:MAG: polymer-forming cytoskeletal protein, partial [Methylococcaceae bacterium]|nr:polymer-forming cytoskeletal protein [Methylococcaceae bacterium]